MSHTEQYIEAQAAANELVDVPQLVTYIIQDGLDHAASEGRCGGEETAGNLGADRHH